MCGIAGFVEGAPGRGLEALDRLGRGATDTLEHRGPDFGAHWSDPEAGLVLAFRRLAIIDLSAAGRQPMHSADGRHVMVFNGEIYNHRDLRAELEADGIAFRGHSDTEVFLAACLRWGLDGALTRGNGMFALALWDRRERRLSLAVDRFGQKPLYYGWLGKTLAFASEPKALRHHPDFGGEIDRGALTHFLRHGYVPSPLSIYRGLRKLTAGRVLTLDFDPERARARELPAPRPYWSAEAVARAGLADQLPDDPEAALDALDAVLRRAVGRCMVADVPLGAFLSGGIDSSTVVALMQAQSDRPVKTYAIGFHEDGYDEAGHAAAVARYLGTEHHELYVTAAEAQAVIPKLPRIYDEPFADSSQIPTYLVSALARRSVTVALSGDGGDELFGGYNRYLFGGRLDTMMRRVPRPLRRLAAGGLRGLPVPAWDGLFKLAAPLLPRGLRHALPGDKLHKLGGILDAADADEMYLRLTSLWPDPGAAVPGTERPWSLLTRTEDWPDLVPFTNRMILLDSLTYLPDDILVKLDRASMAVGLESRVPLLDHEVAAFAWRVPLAMKIRDGRGKWLLRRLLGRYLPETLYQRPKMGFGVPIGDWLRGDLRDWAEALLDPARLRRAGYLDPAAVRTLWRQHLTGRRNWQHQIWAVLMFEAWRET